MNLDQLTEEHDEEGLDAFYISFGDLMVILCVFLVMLLTMSKIEVGSFEKIKSVLTGSSQNTLVELSESLQEIIEGTPGVPGTSVRIDKDGVRVDLDTSILFDQGKSNIREDAIEKIEPILQKILTTEYMIDVEGHTDDVPYYRIIDGETVTNWSLSGKRASSMILHLRNLGFSADRLRAVGYAHTQPVITTKGKRGEELENARARNRRVALLIR
ncbi:OmpA/MotB family protein [Pleionea sediminis]|uniref:OmpA/MotB family protein n=1 Tax=Pleionea sediminis TaxID=2569479 RepID=UPI0011865242|nr:OmpA family protein [Pleionea sediminis]